MSLTSQDKQALCLRCGMVRYWSQASPALATVHCAECSEVIGLELRVKGIAPPGMRLEQRRQHAPAVRP